jgi:hypothetical protein
MINQNILKKLIVHFFLFICVLINSIAHILFLLLSSTPHHHPTPLPSTGRWNSSDDGGLQRPGRGGGPAARLRRRCQRRFGVHTAHSTGRPIQAACVDIAAVKGKSARSCAPACRPCSTSIEPPLPSHARRSSPRSPPTHARPAPALVRPIHASAVAMLTSHPPTNHRSPRPSCAPQDFGTASDAADAGGHTALAERLRAAQAAPGPE